jgi:menaquinone-dependent protoporphyrinogen IX oxidase
VSALAKGIQEQGHDVTVVDATTDAGMSLTPFGYIVVGARVPSYMAKSVPSSLGAFLRSAGHLPGKRCYAFIGGKGLRKGRFLASLMKTVEAEGVLLKRSDALSNEEEARAVGARLHIEKKSTV